MRPTTISFDDPDEAESTRAALEAAGHYVETGRERFLGEDDDEEVVFLLLTDAEPDVARAFVEGDGFVVG
ncbi:hypothetical protein BW730_04965 [Tessaracoccus aquimaris]|uniref:Uncharacterized protein n=1 Tax=Tessaracoccus aquimaris TaxID=1332264 RepID=A0A1Q2CLI2_9ACTN|nr:hypothetical protein [Tessaracoccus aquimaris]AQP46967.1 hypothetical protein BW730_04965 [Tessaracoccus aquimaris]